MKSKVMARKAGVTLLLAFLLLSMFAVLPIEFTVWASPGWTTKAAMTEPRGDPSAAVIGDDIYVTGGYHPTSGAIKTSTYAYDVSANTWSTKENMLLAVHSHISCALGTKVYVFGGVIDGIGTVCNDTQIYDSVGNSWSYGEDSPANLAAGAAFAWNSTTIIVIDAYHNYRYRVDLDQWFTGYTIMPFPRQWAAGALVADAAYVLGGEFAGLKCQKYNVTTDAWSDIADIPANRYGFAREHAAVGNFIYCYAGMNPAGTFHTNLYVYDVIENSWDTKTSGAYARDGHCVGVVDNKLYFIGGRNTDPPSAGLAYNEEYAAPTTAWWDSDWDYRKKITFDNTASAVNLVNFPVLVHITSSDIEWTHVQDDLDDIRFVDSDNITLLDAELESYTVNDKAWIWAEVPQINAGSSTDHIWLYYGNPTVSSDWDPEGTWNSNYKMVQHMKDETTSTILDSTVNNNDGTKTAANQPAEGTGKIGKAQHFDDGTSDYVNCGTGATLKITGDLTLEAWLYIDDEPAGTHAIVARYETTNNDRSYNVEITAVKTIYGYFSEDGTWNVGFRTSSLGTAGGVPVGSWAYFAITYKLSTEACQVFKNGADDTNVVYTEATGIHSGAEPLLIGAVRAAGIPTRFMDGSIDEVRVSNVVRSADWLEAQYLAMTGDFITFGTEETEDAGDTTPPTFSEISHSTTINGTPCDFKCRVQDTVGLSGFIFGTNNTGSWENETFTALTGTDDWAEKTKTLNSGVGVRVEYRFWANDTSDNWGDTGIQFLITTSAGAPAEGSIVATIEDINSFKDPCQRQTFYADGRHWVLYADKVGADHYLYFKSSPDGASWSSATSLGNVGTSQEAISPGGMHDASLFYKDPYVHLTKATGSAAANDIWYRRGNPQSDGTIDWDSDWVVAFAGGWHKGFARPNIAVDSQGYAWIGCISHEIFIYIHTYRAWALKNARNDGGWSTAGSWVLNPTGSYLYRVVPVPLDDNKMCLLFASDGSYVFARWWSGTAMSGAEQATPFGCKYKDRFSAVALNDTVYVTYLKYVGEVYSFHCRKKTYGGSWGDAASLSITAGINWAPIMVRNSTSPNQVLVFWAKNNVTANYILYKVWSGTSWSAETQMYNWTSSFVQYTISGFYENYGGKIGIAALSPHSSYDVIYGWITWLGYLPPPPPDPITFGWFEIDNMNAKLYDGEVEPISGWLYAEEKYYNFKLTASSQPGYTIKDLRINFTDGAYRNIVLYYNNQTSTGGILNGTDYVSLAHGTTSAIVYNHTVVVTWRVLIRLNIIDKLNVTFYACGNATTDYTTGWVTVRENYAHIYSAGGMITDFWTSGNAGILTGGDVFDLYAFNNSAVEVMHVYKRLQHIRLTPTIRFYLLSVNPSRLIHYEIMYKTEEAEWETAIRVAISWVNCSDVPTERYACFQIRWYNSILQQVKYDYIFAGLFDEAYAETNQTINLYVDLWFNKMNASSIVGGRVGAYYYPMKDDADWWTRWWSGSTWAVDEVKRTESWFFTRITDSYDEGQNTVYAKQIELIKLRAYIYQSVVYVADPLFTVSEYKDFDLVFAPSNLEGIPTPECMDPKVPALYVGGIFGWLGGALAGVFNAIVATMSPVLNALASASIATLDAIIFGISLGTIKNGASNFIAFLGQVGATIMTFITTLAGSFTHIGLLLSGAFTWTFTVFESLWGILDFLIFTPSFNVFTAFATIVGVSLAWLGGTVYTNGWGQTYDFTYLSGFKVPGTNFSGGITIFFLIFVCGFFIQILACFSTMSLGPIIEPIMLFVGVVNFVIGVVKILWDITLGFVDFIIGLIAKLRTIAPRPFGFTCILTAEVMQWCHDNDVMKNG